MVCFGDTTRTGYGGLYQASAYIGDLLGHVVLQVGGDSIAFCNTGLDSALSWLEEYADRQDEGRIGVDHGYTPGIVLYSRNTPNSPLTQGIQVASCVATRGVEVVATTLFRLRWDRWR